MSGLTLEREREVAALGWSVGCNKESGEMKSLISGRWQGLKCLERQGVSEGVWRKLPGLGVVRNLSMSFDCI